MSETEYGLLEFPLVPNDIAQKYIAVKDISRNHSNGYHAVSGSLVSVASTTIINMTIGVPLFSSFSQSLHKQTALFSYYC